MKNKEKLKKEIESKEEIIKRNLNLLDKDSIIELCLQYKFEADLFKYWADIYNEALKCACEKLSNFSVPLETPNQLFDYYSEKGMQKAEKYKI